MTTFPFYAWLEPSRRADLDAGLRARVSDPLWFLARQWQLGEHQGEDASSPVSVTFAVRHEPITYDPARPDLDPTSIPAEALVEAEPGDWWTMGRRARLGRAAEPLLAGLTDAQRDALRFGMVPAPYEALATAIDGLAVFTGEWLPANPIFDKVPASLPDCWSSSELTHHAAFQAGPVTLNVTDHDGGSLDWYSADGSASAAGAPGLSHTVIPSRLKYPGAPNPRWWEIEDEQVDVGGFSPDRSHLGSVLLLDVALAHSDDWFWFPVPPPPPPPGLAQPTSGTVVTLGEVTVLDSFGEKWTLSPPPGAPPTLPVPPDAWSLFRTTGLDPSSLVVWPVVVSPAASAPMDDVVLGIDEDADVAWAVELCADGLALLPTVDTSRAAAAEQRTATRDFRYAPSSALPPHWHPYRREEPGAPIPPPNTPLPPWQQGLVADLTFLDPAPRAGPTSRLIGGTPGLRFGQGHKIEGRAILSSGLRLQRRWMLARDVHGRPVLWVERSARPLISPPVSHLRFDLFVEAPPEH